MRERLWANKLCTPRCIYVRGYRSKRQTMLNANLNHRDRAPSRSARRISGLSLSYCLAISKTTSPHSNSPCLDLFLHGLCLMGRNQSMTLSPILSFQPIKRDVYQGCSNGFVCITTYLRPEAFSIVLNTGHASSCSEVLEFLFGVGGVAGNGGGRDELKTSRAILWTPPRWIASTDVKLIIMFQPVIQAIVNVNIQKMTATTSAPIQVPGRDPVCTMVR